MINVNILDLLAVNYLRDEWGYDNYHKYDFLGDDYKGLRNSFKAGFKAALNLKEKQMINVYAIARLVFHVVTVAYLIKHW